MKKNVTLTNVKNHFIKLIIVMVKGVCYPNNFSFCKITHSCSSTPHTLTYSKIGLSTTCLDLKNHPNTIIFTRNCPIKAWLRLDTSRQCKNPRPSIWVAGWLFEKLMNPTCPMSCSSLVGNHKLSQKPISPNP